MDKILITLWDLIEALVKNMSMLWDWLSQDIKINISWLKIPVILPDGIDISLGFSFLSVFGAGITILILLWVVKSLVPLG